MQVFQGITLTSVMRQVQQSDVSSILTTFVVDEANLYVGIRYLFRNFSPRHDAGGNFRLPYANLPVDDSAVSDDDAVTEPMPRWSLNTEALW